MTPQHFTQWLGGFLDGCDAAYTTEYQSVQKIKEKLKEVSDTTHIPIGPIHRGGIQPTWLQNGQIVAQTANPVVNMSEAGYADQRGLS